MVRFGCPVGPISIIISETAALALCHFVFWGFLLLISLASWLFAAARMKTPFRAASCASDCRLYAHGVADGPKPDAHGAYVCVIPPY